MRKIFEKLMEMTSGIKHKLFSSESFNVRFLSFAFSPTRWFIFLERSAMVVIILLFALILWVFPISLIVAPFYSSTHSKQVDWVVKYKTNVGLTTTNSIRDNIIKLEDRLVTNFFAVRWWIDNRENEQIGLIQMYRVALYMLENHLGRNRGSGGANKCLESARADINADYTLPIFTSYNTRLRSAIENIDCYTKQLVDDKSKSMNNKKAVFVVNSDNLAEVLDKLKQQLQTNLKNPESIGFFEQDDTYFVIRGNLIAIYTFLKGIDHDFKDKMVDKTSYEENFLPILELLEEAIALKPDVIVWEVFGDLSELIAKSRLITDKMGELRDKLRKG